MRMRFVFMRGEDLRDEGEGASVREWNGDGGYILNKQILHVFPQTGKWQGSVSCVLRNTACHY